MEAKSYRGHTLRCFKVLTANENRAAIGFLDESLPGRRMTASQIAAFNNRREAQWGVSLDMESRRVPDARHRGALQCGRRVWKDYYGNQLVDEWRKAPHH